METRILVSPYSDTTDLMGHTVLCPEVIIELRAAGKNPRWGTLKSSPGDTQALIYIQTGNDAELASLVAKYETITVAEFTADGKLDSKADTAAVRAKIAEFGGDGETNVLIY